MRIRLLRPPPSSGQVASQLVVTIVLAAAASRPGMVRKQLKFIIFKPNAKCSPVISLSQTVIAERTSYSSFGHDSPDGIVHKVGDPARRWRQRPATRLSCRTNAWLKGFFAHLSTTNPESLPLEFLPVESFHRSSALHSACFSHEYHRTQTHPANMFNAQEHAFQSRRHGSSRHFFVVARLGAYYRKRYFKPSRDLQK